MIENWVKDLDSEEMFLIRAQRYLEQDPTLRSISVHVEVRASASAGEDGAYLASYMNAHYKGSPPLEKLDLAQGALEILRAKVVEGHARLLVRYNEARQRLGLPALDTVGGEAESNAAPK